MSKINCILLVDDDKASNFLNELLIQDLGIASRIEVAKNGVEALQMIDQYNKNKHVCPELILLDINMPVMDGFEFLQTYQNLNFDNKQSVIIVMLTSSSNPKDIEKVKQAGIEDFLTKPLTEEKLNKVVEKYFNE